MNKRFLLQPESVEVYRMRQVLDGLRETVQAGARKRADEASRPYMLRAQVAKANCAADEWVASTVQGGREVGREILAEVEAKAEELHQQSLRSLEPAKGQWSEVEPRVKNWQSRIEREGVESLLAAYDAADALDQFCLVRASEERLRPIVDAASPDDSESLRLAGEAGALLDALSERHFGEVNDARALNESVVRGYRAALNRPYGAYEQRSAKFHLSQKLGVLPEFQPDFEDEVHGWTGDDVAVFANEARERAEALDAPEVERGRA